MSFHYMQNISLINDAGYFNKTFSYPQGKKKNKAQLLNYLYYGQNANWLAYKYI